MVAVVGLLVVFGCVIGGFTMAGGHVGSLIHPSEIVTIGGASLGALIVMSPTKVIVDLIKSVIQVLTGSPYGKQMYVELFGAMNALTRMVRREGLLGLDSHVSDPHHSPIFSKYPKLEKNHHAMQFLTAGLALVLDGKENGQIQTALDEELKVIEREHHAAVAALSKTAVDVLQVADGRDRGDERRRQSARRDLPCAARGRQRLPPVAGRHGADRQGNVVRQE
jgi:chemotaxis protein MotA